MILPAVLAVEAVTVLSMQDTITLRIYLGLLARRLGTLKCASTIYRFARYYTGRPSLRSERAATPDPAHPWPAGHHVPTRCARHRGSGLIYTGLTHREPIADRAPIA